MREELQQIINSVNFIRQLRRRYPTIIALVDEPKSELSEQLREVAAQCGLKYINCEEELLASTDSKVTLGAFLRGHFLEWILKQARENGGLVLDKADALIDTWPDREGNAFFREFLRTECHIEGEPTNRVPIVLCSRLAARYALPRQPEGQGLVIDLDEKEG